MVKKILLSIPEELLIQIDNYGETLHINRTSTITVLISQALQAQQGIQSLSTLTNELRKQQLANKE